MKFGHIEHGFSPQTRAAAELQGLASAVEEPTLQFQVVISPKGSEGELRQSAEFLHPVIGEHIVVVPTFSLERPQGQDAQAANDLHAAELIETLEEVASVSPHAAHEVSPTSYLPEHYDPLQGYDAWSLDKPESIQSMHEYFCALITNGQASTSLRFAEYTPQPDARFEPVLLTPKARMRKLGVRTLTLLEVRPLTYRLAATHQLED